MDLDVDTTDDMNLDTVSLLLPPSFMGAITYYLYTTYGLLEAVVLLPISAMAAVGASILTVLIALLLSVIVAIIAAIPFLVILVVLNRVT